MSAPVLVPVEVADTAPTVAIATDSPAQRRGLIEIELGGGLCIRVDSDVDAAALRRVLGVLERR
jgi:transposase